MSRSMRMEIRVRGRGASAAPSHETLASACDALASLAIRAERVSFESADQSGLDNGAMRMPSGSESRRQMVRDGNSCRADSQYPRA